MIELRQLRAFVAVARTLSFSRAAQELHMTQSPLSRSIKNLEQEVGTQLLIRNTQSVTITPAGAAFLQEAQKALRAAEEARKLALRAARNSERNLRLGVSGPTTFENYLTLTRAFNQVRPEVRLVAEGPYNSGKLVERLIDQDVDIALARMQLGHPGIATKVVAEHSIVAAVSNDHDLSHRSELLVEDLRGEVLLTYPAGEGSRAVTFVNSLLVQHGLSPNLIETAADTPTLLFMAAIGQGIGLAPSSAALIRVPGICFKPITDLPNLSLMLAWRKDDRRSIVKDFVACSGLGGA